MTPKVVIEGYSQTVEPFKPGDVVKDHTGKQFGIFEVDVADGNMSRYTCLCFDDGATYENLPHYTMMLVESYESINEKTANGSRATCGKCDAVFTGADPLAELAAHAQENHNVQRKH